MGVFDLGHSGWTYNNIYVILHSGQEQSNSMQNMLFEEDRIAGEASESCLEWYM